MMKGSKKLEKGSKKQMVKGSKKNGEEKLKNAKEE